VGGAPLGGVPLVGQFSPLALPYYVFPLWLAPAFVKLAEFGVAIGGMVAFLRRLRLSTASGVLAGIVFVSSGFMLSWTNWPQTRVAAFIPALFWATERLVQRHRPVDALPLAVVVASMLLGGFPAVTGFALYFAGLYFLVRVVMVHRRRWGSSVSATLLAGLGLALGAGLSAFQMLPFASQLSSLTLGYRAQKSTSHSTLSTLFTTMVPDAQGLCINGDASGPENPIETLAFIGVGAIVLGLVAITMRERRVRIAQRGVVGFLAAAVVVVVTLGWLGGPLLSLAQHLPVFSNNKVTRISSLLGFLVAALAGFGFERLLRAVCDRDGDPPDDDLPDDDLPDDDLPDDDLPDDDLPDDDSPDQTGALRGNHRRHWSQIAWSIVVLSVTTLFALLVLRDAISEARARHEIPLLADKVVIPVVLLVICVVLVIAARTGPRWARWAAIAGIPLIVVGQSAATFRASVPGSDRVNFYPVTSTHSYLLQNLGFDRFAASGLMMYPATSKFYGLRTPTGHAFTADAWKALLVAVDPQVQRTATFSDFRDKTVNASTVSRMPLLDQMAVKYFVAPDFQVVGKETPAPATNGTVTMAAGERVSCSVPAGPVRGVSVTFAGPLVGSAGAGATVHARIRTPGGEITGARSLGQGLRSSTPIVVAVPGEELSAQTPTTAEFWVTGVRRPFALAGSGRSPSCGTVAPAADGLKLVASDAGAIVYQRLTSLPRIRWAATSRVQPDPVARVAELKAGIGPTSVLLDVAAPPSDNKPATVTVTAGDGDRLAANVDAAGAGYLVFADSLQQPGWAATVDGRPAALLPANHAMGAVRVPAGVHRVELVYTPPGQRSGVLISGASLLAMCGILVFWRRSRDEVGEPSVPGLPS
jgi:hypothetical protein